MSFALATTHKPTNDRSMPVLLIYAVQSAFGNLRPIRCHRGSRLRTITILVCWLAALFGPECNVVRAQLKTPPKTLTDRYGAVYRGDTSQKKLALVFTGDELGESTGPILKQLNERGIEGAFFVTGKFVGQLKLSRLLEQAVRGGHYIGPHSDSHPLYCSWEDRKKSLVTEEFFTDDLSKNLKKLRAIGALKNGEPIAFIPPYENHNLDQVRWARKIGVTLINFTPGSGSNRDYAREGDSHFAAAQKIFDDILAYEQKDPHGLNGFVLLMHLGSRRKDPLHPLLGKLCDELKERGYEFERVDRMLLQP